MMTIVSEGALRALVKEAFDTPPGHDVNLVMQADEMPVVINPSVDDSLAAVELSPVDVQFVPRDKVEFELAIKQMAKNLPDDIIPLLYAKVREVMMDQEAKSGPDDQGDTEEMEKRRNSTLGMEESLRNAIKQMLKEIRLDEMEPPVGIAGGKHHKRTDLDDELDDEIEGSKVWDPEEWENTVDPEGLAAHAKDVDDEEFGNPDSWDTDDVDADTASDWDPEPAALPPGHKTHNRKELDGGVGVEGDVFKKLAAELGISVSGAKRLATTGAGKLKYLASLEDRDVKDILHTAARDWVEKLVDADRLSDAEGMDWIRKLNFGSMDQIIKVDEFREFLHNYIRDEMKRDDEWVYKDKEDEKE